jgi:ureidoglycolate lyase
MPPNHALAIRILEARSFAPYGWMLGKPMPRGGGIPVFSNPATDFWQEHLFDTGAGGEPEILWVNYRNRNETVESLEMHRLTQQVMVPLSGPVIQIVATSLQDGRPDLSTLAAFRVPPGKGICMRPGCWHATRVRREEVTCLMLTRRSTTVDLIHHLTTGSASEESAILPAEIIIPAD